MAKQLSINFDNDIIEEKDNKDSLGFNNMLKLVLDKTTFSYDIVLKEGYYEG